MRRKESEIMTLDEAIQHALEVAIAKEEEAYEGELQLDSTDIMGCRKCAAEHRQLAEWLKDYKSLLNGKPQTAKWKLAHDEHMPYLYCSNCGLNIELYESTKYCPNCGAKMEGGLNK